MHRAAPREDRPAVEQPSWNDVRRLRRAADQGSVLRPCRNRRRRTSGHFCLDGAFCNKHRPKFWCIQRNNGVVACYVKTAIILEEDVAFVHNTAVSVHWIVGDVDQSVPSHFHVTNAPLVAWVRFPDSPLVLQRVQIQTGVGASRCSKVTIHDKCVVEVGGVYWAQLGEIVRDTLRIANHNLSAYTCNRNT